MEFIQKGPISENFYFQVNPDSIGAEAGWMKGKLKGSEGCFPEAYVQRIDDTRVSEQPVEVVQGSLRQVPSLVG